ncbi:MAG: heavy metal translocating P-type ATPase, partial [Veillonella sp.]|nr:heavy metal translocating P-type ATPase [Veillonella sp.]
VVDTDCGGEIVVMAPEKVEVGWTIEVRPGDLIPLDGTVLEGETRVNTAPVTGEPVPVRAVPGTQLMSGCINESGRITMRVDKVLEESMVTKILDAVENAASSKPKIDRFITRFARVYTPIVVALALAVAIIPSLITGEWHKWIYTALTFLVISCPCALVLSVPLAFFSGIGNASKHGILLKGGRVIEALANVKAVALDKTGTITSGEFKVHSVETVGSHVSSSQLLSMAAAIEAVSTHPIATSIVSEAKDQGLTVEPSDFVQELAGEGMVGMADGQQVLIGNRRLMERYNVQGYPTEAAEYGTEVLVAEGNTYLGRIIIADEARPDSAEAIANLNGQDIKTVMLTGDAEASANYIAKETGVSAV